MSTDTSPIPDHSDRDQLTDQERAALERLADGYEGQPLGEAFESLLQSADPTEETTS